MSTYYESQVIEVPLVTNRIESINDVTYSQVKTHGYSLVDLKMDILRPKVNYKLPCVVFITGGGFISSNRSGHMNIRMRLVEEGYFVASIEYRFAPQSHLPAPIIDAKAAVRYLKANADIMGIDPNRIGVMGTSAGGFLASFVGVTGARGPFDEGDNLNYKSDVKCVVDIYGVSDLTKMAEGFSEQKKKEYSSSSACQALWLNGCTICGGVDASVDDLPDEVYKYNPANYIDENTPPFLLFHGLADTLVSEQSIDLLFQALKNKGVKANRYLVKNAGHGGPYWVQKPVQDIILKFLDDNLKQTNQTKIAPSTQQIVD